MLAHSMPKPGGKLPPPQLNACSSHQFAEMIKADEASQKLFIDRYLEEGIKLDYWWMDAGWYPCQGEWPQHRHLGSRQDPIPQRASRDQRPRPDEGHQDDRLVRAGAARCRQSGCTRIITDWVLGDTLLNLGNPEGAASGPSITSTR